ncbi:Hypothetical_protein [Hexamita inflata]|uniref:Hypothetical_protein n=1 Tax=Hexamita inflata TaxID=28002 RepID=A0AA86NM45_9EUKA|nr:Hypothetical protein HINF_LOCUS9051 [Hexamita inflata]
MRTIPAAESCVLNSNLSIQWLVVHRAVQRALLWCTRILEMRALFGSLASPQCWQPGIPGVIQNVSGRIVPFETAAGFQRRTEAEIKKPQTNDFGETPASMSE